MPPVREDLHLDVGQGGRRSTCRAFPATPSEAEMTTEPPSFTDDQIKKILLELGISVIDVRTFYRENHQPGLIQVTHAYDAFTAHPAVTLNSAS